MKKLESIVHPLVADARRVFLTKVRERWAAGLAGCTVVLGVTPVCQQQLPAPVVAVRWPGPQRAPSVRCTCYQRVRPHGPAVDCCA
jgi:hypothetical protein